MVVNKKYDDIKQSLIFSSLAGSFIFATKIERNICNPVFQIQNTYLYLIFFYNHHKNSSFELWREKRKLPFAAFGDFWANFEIIENHPVSKREKLVWLSKSESGPAIPHRHA